MKAETKQAIALVQKFEALTPFKARERKSGKEGLPGWQMLALQTAKQIKDEYETSASTLAVKKKILAELKSYQKDWLIDAANYYPVQTIISHFREALNFLFAECQLGVNQDYRNRVEARSTDENRIECDLTVYLQKAYKVLTLASEGATKEVLKWEDVSCAIALVTGRRMSEIHYSAIFEATDSHALNFQGQLKGKEKRVNREKVFDHVYSVPSLIPASLVVEGLKWLKREGKRLDRKTGSAEQVNKTWGKYLARRAKSEWQIIEDEVWQEVDAIDKWTYHKLRGIYYSCCLHNYLSENLSFFSAKKKALEILGDGDHKTLESYERVDIKSGSLTKI